jgi:hypothetical protein
MCSGSLRQSATSTKVSLKIGACPYAALGKGAFWSEERRHPGHCRMRDNFLAQPHIPVLDLKDRIIMTWLVWSWGNSILLFAQSIPA